MGGAYSEISNRILKAGQYRVIAIMQDDTRKEADANVVAGERTEIIIE